MKDDTNFYAKISPVFAGKKYLIPQPKLSPRERERRRLSFRNERNLYHRKCDLSGRQIISMYSSDKAYRVFDQSEWWSDKWDAMDYGRNFDFSRGFFEQFAELFIEVPRINLINKQHENSEYCNFAISNKDCYLLFTSGWCQNSAYSNRILHSSDVFDCSGLINSELCYEVIDSDKCYGCAWLSNSSNCSDCWLGYDLRGCKDCFACYSLVNKQYCIGNKQFTKEEYFSKVAEMKNDFRRVKEGYELHLKTVARKFMNGVNNENCSGDCVSNSKNAECCFEVQQLEDCKFVSNATKLKDCCDVDNDDHSELNYETVGADSCYNQCFSDISWFNSNLYYSSLCFNSKDCFGCIGLKQKQYCIFNKQYTREAYEELVPKIIEHMEKLGEWGEFFPSEMSPFAYNETMAQDYYELSKEEVLARGLKWHTDESEKMYKGPEYLVPDRIEDVEDDVCGKILKCGETGKLYKINIQELKFYRKMGIALPRLCPEQRHKKRLLMRNPRELNARKCDKCSAEMMSSYSSDYPAKIYCKDCYEAEKLV